MTAVQAQGGRLLTEVLQGFCQARQAIKAELMNGLIQLQFIN